MRVALARLDTQTNNRAELLQPLAATRLHGSTSCPLSTQVFRSVQAEAQRALLASLPWRAGEAARQSERLAAQAGTRLLLQATQAPELHLLQRAGLALLVARACWARSASSSPQLQPAAGRSLSPCGWESEPAPGSRLAPRARSEPLSARG